MRGPSRLAGLTLLHRIAEPGQREATWRQSVANLAHQVIDQRRPVPLEGLNPESLLRSIDVAIKEGYVAQLDWLSAPAAAAALYEIAAALPASVAKREIGRLVLERLHQGDAATFVALATQLALGSQRALAGPAIRARVALSLNLPIGTVAYTDALALALISRRELSREWLRIPSTGGLPSRRLAARLLERAAREAARRAVEGDDSGVRVFSTGFVREAWERLLADRESLVWRHVASARGLLSTSMPAFREEISRHLSPDFSITEWRRAAASLATSIAIDPEASLATCRQLLESSIFEQDRGIAAAMILGLPRAAEGYPEAVEELLGQLVQVGGLDTAEALVDFRRERVREGFGNEAAHQAAENLRESMRRSSSEDEGRTALMAALADELAESAEEASLKDLLANALDAFAAGGAMQAWKSAEHILRAADAKVSLLEEHDLDTVESRHRAFRALRELDLALFETDALSNLLLLGEHSGGERDRRLGDLFQRITNWLVIREGDPILQEGAVPNFTTRLRQLRTMLHLVDADGRQVDDRPELIRQRRLLTTRVLLSRVHKDEDSPLRRALCAATARACDGLVREELVEVSDIVIAAASYVPHQQGLTTMAEASMVPAIKNVLRAYARLQKAAQDANPEGRGLRSAIDALQALGNELPVARSPRVEALRMALLDLHRSLRLVAFSGSLMELSELSTNAPLASLERAVGAMVQLVSGAQRRLGDTASKEAPKSAGAIRTMGVEVERALKTSVSEMDRAFANAASVIGNELPGAFGDVTRRVLDHLRSVPLDAPRRTHATSAPEPQREAPLPAWMPPGRTLGGFFVVRPIAAGAAGSVFVARRSDERTDTSAKEFALKVPDYSGAAARTLSEEEFLRLFREEAGALLALPEHPNIARFVTFDVGARPKPILVMELVEGPSLERMVEMGDLTTRRAIELLLGVSAGLDAMHQVGVSHLDVKPSNIIVRSSDRITSAGRPADPVLVDFGLAGRNLRPGCGTAQYGAPEIWGAGETSQAIPADVYAFGCLIYEALTGETLFDGPSEVAMITRHVSHDGAPEAVEALAKKAQNQDLAELIRCCLRRDPVDRITIRQARQLLANLKPKLEPIEWPLAA